MRQGLARVLGGAAILALVAGAAACNKSSSTGGGTTKKNCGFEIAYFGALTGSAANLGVNIEQGYELALDQYNDKNGKDCIGVKKFDSQGDPAVAPGLARQLVYLRRSPGRRAALLSGALLGIVYVIVFVEPLHLDPAQRVLAAPVAMLFSLQYASNQLGVDPTSFWLEIVTGAPPIDRVVSRQLSLYVLL